MCTSTQRTNAHTPRVLITAASRDIIPISQMTNRDTKGCAAQAGQGGLQTPGSSRSPDSICVVGDLGKYTCVCAHAHACGRRQGYRVGSAVWALFIPLESGRAAGCWGRDQVRGCGGSQGGWAGAPT